MNRKLVGQHQYFTRVSFTGNKDLIERLTEEGYTFSVDRKEFTDGVTRTVILANLTIVPFRPACRQAGYKGLS